MLVIAAVRVLQTDQGGDCNVLQGKPQRSRCWSRDKAELDDKSYRALRQRVQSTPTRTTGDIMTNPIDLRSDTVTRPTEAMRAAMAAALVGDDQYGEDPSTNQLQARCADLLGKEAAVWVPSGTMANQVALRTLTRPGDEAIASRESHAAWHELGVPRPMRACRSTKSGRVAALAPRTCGLRSSLGACGPSDHDAGRGREHAQPCRRDHRAAGGGAAGLCAGA